MVFLIIVKGSLKVQMEKKMNTQKPLLLLDIDGVLNILTHTHPYMTRDVGSNMGLESTTILGYFIQLNPSHGEMIRNFEENFTIIWSTMWQENAPTHFASKVGYGHAWEYINFGEHNGNPELFEAALAQSRHHQRSENVNWGRNLSVGNFKHPGYLATIKNEPAVIVDDDLEPWQHLWVEERNHSGVPTLLIQPEPWTGLTRTHAETIMNFAHTTLNN